MLPVLLATIFSPSAHAPSIARIMGLDVGSSGWQSVVSRFGQGTAGPGSGADRVLVWRLASPPSVLYLQGSPEPGQKQRIVMGVLWTSDPIVTDVEPHGSAPVAYGWLDKIRVGSSEADALTTAKKLLGNPDVMGDRFEWTRQSSSTLNWRAIMICDKGKVRSITVLCNGISGNAKVAAAKADLATIASALQIFRLDCDRYPTTKEGLGALLIEPAGLKDKWKGPYLTRPVPRDPWGNPYVYVYRGQDRFRLESYGADGKPGGTGDAADIVEDSD